MRRLSIWLVCLLLLLPCPAFAGENALTEGVNQGSCRSLTGAVQLLVVFVDSPEFQWLPGECASFRTRIDDAVALLELEAMEYGASLSIAPVYVTAQVTEPYNPSDPWPLVEQAFANTPALLDAVLETQLLETPVLLCLPQRGRCGAFTAQGEDMEYVILFSDADAGSIRHELLHLYGAKDFYYHEDVKAAAQRAFPDSIMLDDGPASTVDSFTAWCIGWTDQLDPVAEQFLQDTAHITPEMLATALADTLYTGFITLEREDGTYTGMMVNGQFHGTGIFQWHSGTFYAGQWVDGKPHGHGTYQWDTGTCYTGDFFNGQRSGQGVMSWPGGTLYTGDFADGSRTGKGIMRWPDGSSYTGDFLSDAITGTGVFTWPDGSSYTGGLLEGVCHGQGVYTYPDGSSTTGTWEHGKLME